MIHSLIQKPKHPSRQGSASVMSMMYMAMFTVLAVSLFGLSDSNLQTAAGLHRSRKAYAATEAGVSLIRYQLMDVNLPGSTTQANLMSELATDLADILNGSGTINYGNISLSGNTITLPAYSPFDDAGGTTCSIKLDRVGDQIELYCVGATTAIPPISRAIRISFARATRASAIFDYGVASRSPASLSGNSQVLGGSNAADGSVLSTSYTSNQPVSVTGNAMVSGDISMTNPNGTVSLNGNLSIGGETDPALIADHVHSGVPEPEFPAVDVSGFTPYATNVIDSSTSLPSGATFDNVRIAANTNPTFNNNTTIPGVMYIEAPNQVKFNGSAAIQGVIIAEPAAGTNVNTNTIEFTGNVSATGVETLPSDPQFTGLHEMTGSFILAEGFALDFSGNLGSIGGTIVGSQFDFSGNASGTVYGTVINMDDSAFTFGGSTTVTIESQGTSGVSTGLIFGENFVPLPDTYEEPQL